MPYKAPGLGDDRLDWILLEIRQAQATLDSRIAEAQALPDTEPSKAKRIARLNQMKREIDTVYSELQQKTQIWADRDLRSFYRQGHSTASAQLGTGFSFTTPHKEAIDIMVDDAFDDVATRLQQVSDGFGANVELQKVFESLDPSQVVAIQEQGRSAVAQMLLTGTDPRKISKRLAQDLWSQGISIIDSGGRQWNPETYTRMLIRTKSANAYNAGSMNKYAEEGVTRVQVFDGIEDDVECAEANGQVWSLRYAMNNVIQHPNCRRAFAPLQGQGEVDRDTESKWIVAFDKIELGIGAVAALRAFRATGELNVSSTLARLFIETGEILTGVHLPVIDVFVQGLVSGAFKELDAYIESYIDPLLYSIGMIRNVPPRAGLQAALRPDTLISTLTESIKKANLEAFGVEFNPQIRGTLDRLDRLAGQALAKVGGAVAEVGERGGLKWVDWVVNQAVVGDRYGQITAEVIRAAKNGEIEDLRSAWAVASSHVDDLREIRRLYIESALATREDAERIYEELTELLLDFSELLSNQADIKNFPAVLEFMELYDQGNPLQIERIIQYWSEQGRAIDFNDYEVRKFSEMFQEALDARNRAIARIAEIDGIIDDRAQRQLLMAAPSGPDFPSELRSIWDPDLFDETALWFEDGVRDALGATSQLAVNPKMLDEFQEFFRFLHAKNPNSDDARNIFKTYLHPKFDGLESWVVLEDIPTLDDQVEFFLDVMRGIELDPRTGAIVVDEVLDSAGVVQLEKIMSWWDHEDYFKNPTQPWRMVVGQHWIPDLFLRLTPFQNVVAAQQLAGAGFMRFWDDLRVAIREFSPGAPVRKFDPYAQTYEFLTDTFGPGAVVALTDSGVNGTIYRVTNQATGESITVKRIASPHAGSNQPVAVSLLGTEYVAQSLGEVEAIPYRLVSVGPDDLYVVSPYINDTEHIRLLPYDDLREDAMHRLTLFDALTMERDAHSENYLVQTYLETIIPIDREMSFGLFQGVQNFNDYAELGLNSNVTWRTTVESIKAWIDGDDIDFVRLAPDVRLVRLLDHEVETITGLLPTDVAAIARTVSQKRLGGQIAGIEYFREAGLIIDELGAVSIPAGRVGWVRFPGQGIEDRWVVSIFPTETEYRFLERLMDGDAAANSTFQEIRDHIEIQIGGLHPNFLDEFVQYWEVNSLEEALDASAYYLNQKMRNRVQRMLDGGAINISGGVSRHVDPDTGEILEFGKDYAFRNKETGEVIEGLVVNIYERDFESGDVWAIVYPEIGIGRSSTQLATVVSVPQRINLSDYRWGDAVEETVELRLNRYKAAVRDQLEHSGAAPMVRDAPVIDRYGQFTGYKQNTIAIEVDNFRSESIRAIRSDGMVISTSLHEMKQFPELVSILEDELDRIAPQFRPRSIELSLEKLSTSDGRSAYGMFDPETGILRLSLLPILKSDRLDAIRGLSATWTYRLPDGVGIDEPWLFDADWDAIRRILRHELGHASDIGLERVRLNNVSLAVFEQWHNEFKSADINILDALVDSRGGIPDWFDRTRYQTDLEALVAYRAGLVEDVLNSNAVFQAKFLLETGLDNKTLPPWARAAYEGIIREEPEAHHEFFADLYRRFIELGGSTNPSQALRVLGQDDLGLRSFNELEVLRKFLFRDEVIVLPSDWDLGSADFVRWLESFLYPGANRIVPLDRSVNRRLWNAERYNLADIRTRVFDTPAEEGGGGITINVITGRQPVRGHSVAKAANERIYSGVTEEADFNKLVLDYIEEFKFELEQPQWQLGMWLSPEGDLYLDTVRVFDDEIDAAVFGFREGQRAMYRLDDGNEINLLDEFSDIYEYIAKRHPDLEYLDIISKVEKIPGVTAHLTRDGEKILEEIFDPQTGRFRTLSLEWMSEADKEALIRAVSERYSISITVEEGKENLERILRRGLELFEEEPDLEDEFKNFYFFWRDTFIDAAAETKGRNVEISVEQIAAAAASMSASLEAERNLVTVLNMVDVISRDLRMTKRYVEATRENLERTIVAAQKRLRTARNAGRVDRIDAELDFIRTMEELADSFRVGQKVNIMDPQRRMRAIAGIIAAEDRAHVAVPRRWSFYEKSAAILLGEIEPSQALTDTKFRPFFNNIMDPGDIDGTLEATIDFVMGDAFFFSRGMRDINHTSPVINGIQAGLRPVIGDTLRELFDEGWGERLGLTSVSQLQSVVWNLFRYGVRNEWWDLERIALVSR